LGVIEATIPSRPRKQKTVLPSVRAACISADMSGRARVRSRGRTSMTSMAAATVARVPSDVSTDASPPWNEMNALMAAALFA
jgi:hypothetical protein